MNDFRKFLTVGPAVSLIIVMMVFIGANSNSLRRDVAAAFSPYMQSAASIFSQGPYSVNVSVVGSGLVSGESINCGAVCSRSVPYGTSVTLSATPADGYSLLLWGGSCSGASTNCNFSVSGNSAVTVLFVSVDGNASATNSSAVFSLFSAPNSKTLRWKPATYSSTASFNFNLIKKISDVPLSYDFVRQLDRNIPNSGMFSWIPQGNETDSELYVEVTCGSDASSTQACQVSADPVKVN